MSGRAVMTRSAVVGKSLSSDFSFNNTFILQKTPKYVKLPFKMMYMPLILLLESANNDEERER